MHSTLHGSCRMDKIIKKNIRGLLDSNTELLFNIFQQIFHLKKNMITLCPFFLAAIVSKCFEIGSNTKSYSK